MTKSISIADKLRPPALTHADYCIRYHCGPSATTKIIPREPGPCQLPTMHMAFMTATHFVPRGPQPSTTQMPKHMVMMAEKVLDLQTFDCFSDTQDCTITIILTLLNAQAQRIHCQKLHVILELQPTMKILSNHQALNNTGRAALFSPWHL